MSKEYGPKVSQIGQFFSAHDQNQHMANFRRGYFKMKSQIYDLASRPRKEKKSFGVSISLFSNIKQ